MVLRELSIFKIITVAIIAIIYGVVTYKEPKFIKVCASSHTEQYYQAPTYVCSMYNDMGGCAMSIPVGGGMRDKTVCDEWKEKPNPKYVRP